MLWLPLSIIFFPTDLSFPVTMADYMVESVNDNTLKTAPPEAIGQLGHSLKRIVHALA